jgi:hypothetical protein
MSRKLVTDFLVEVTGPTPRRLPTLPIKVADGVLNVAGAFSGRGGFQ